MGYPNEEFSANSVKSVRANHNDFVRYVGFEETTEAQTENQTETA